MALCHKEIVTLFLCMIASVCCFKPPTIVSTSQNVTRKDPNFHMFSICPGNFTSCMSGCPYNISLSGLCLACKCPDMQIPNSISTNSIDHVKVDFKDEFSKPTSTIPVDAGSLTFHLGSYDAPWWKRVFGGVDYYPGATYPYVLYKITKNKVADNGTTRSDFADLLRRAKLADRPVLLPVAIMDFNSNDARVTGNSTNMYEIIPGSIHLPFKVNITKMLSLPAMGFPMCQLQGTNKNSMNMEGMNKLISFLLTNVDVMTKLNSVLQSMNPGISMINGFSCGNLTDENINALDFLKRYSSGNQSFSMILQHLRQVENELQSTLSNKTADNTNITARFRQIILNLQNISKNYNYDDKVKANMLKHILSDAHMAVMKFYNLVKPLFVNGTHQSLYTFLQEITRFYHGSKMPEVPSNVEDKVAERLLDLISDFSDSKANNVSFIDILKSLKSFSLKKPDQKKEKVLSMLIRLIEKLQEFDSVKDRTIKMKNALMLLANHTEFAIPVLSFQNISKDLEPLRIFKTLQDLQFGLLKIIEMTKKAISTSDIEVRTKHLVRVVNHLFMTINGTKKIDRIIGYLDKNADKIPKGRQPTFKHFKKLVEQLKEIKESEMNDTVWMKFEELILNHTAFDAVILNFNNLSRPDDTDYHLTNSLLYDLLAVIHSKSDIHSKPSVATSPGAVNSHTNLACYLRKLAEYSKGLNVKTMVGRVLNSLCNDTDNGTNWDFHTEQGVEQTMAFIKRFVNKTASNETLDGMLEMSNMTMNNDTKIPGLKMLFEVIKNLSKISKIRYVVNQKKEIVKFWKHSNILDKSLYYHLQMCPEYSVLRRFYMEFSGLVPYFQGRTVVSREDLCKTLKHLLNTTVMDRNMTFAGAVSEYIHHQYAQIANKTGGQNMGNKTTNSGFDIAAISHFLNRNNISLGNMTLGNFAKLVNGLANGVANKVSPYREFVANLTKLVKLMPYDDVSGVTKCVENFENLKNYPLDPMQWDDITLDKEMTPIKCLKAIFGPLSKSDSPLESVKTSPKQIYPTVVSSPKPEKGDGSIPLESKMAGIRTPPTDPGHDCTKYNVPGLILPRMDNYESSHAHGVPIYFKTMNKRVEFEMKKSNGPDVFWGLLWINAGPKFNATNFLRQVATHIKVPDKKNTTDGEGGTKNDTKPEGPKKEFPFQLGDNITEIFVVPDPKKNGTMEVKSVFGDKVKRIVVLKKIGNWIVKDVVRESQQKRREVDLKRDKINDVEQNEKVLKRETLTEEKSKDIPEPVADDKGGKNNNKEISGVDDGEDNCPHTPSSGWRCLQNEDNISSDALLRLVHSDESFAVGILTLAPAGKNESQSEPKAKNLVALAPPKEGLTSIVLPNMKFGFKEKLYDKVIQQGNETTIKVRDTIKVNIAGLQGFDKLEEFARSSQVVRKFLSELIAKVKLPDITVVIEPTVLLKDLTVKYRWSPTAAWNIVTLKPVITFNAGVELSFAAKKGHSGGKKKIMLILKSGDMATVQVKFQTVVTKLTMSIPRDFNLPAITFDNQLNDGFSVGMIAAQLTSLTQSDDALIGLAVMAMPTSKIGKWEYKCDICRGWQNIENGFKTIKEKAKRSVENIGKVRRVRQTDKKCSYDEKTTTKVVLLGPDTRLRFQPDKLNYFWRRTEAWSDAVIGLALYRILPSDEENAGSESNHEFRTKAEDAFRTNGAMTVVGTYNVDPNCNKEDKSDDMWSNVVDLTKLLSSEQEKFVMERLGCDGKRSSMKVKTDRCGVCGGNGKSCVDCNGALNGTATLDVCGKCVGGETGLKASKLDCAMSCDNTSYTDECGFCQQRDKTTNAVKDCLGECFGEAKPDKCGACRLKGNLVGKMPTGKELMDECGVCGGDNSSCSGCDGVPHSGKIRDGCNQCKSPKDTTFNTGCGRVYFIDGTNPPSLVISKINSDMIKFMVYGYFDSFVNANCSLKMNNDVINLGEYVIVKPNSLLKDSKQKKVHYVTVAVKKGLLLPNGKTFAQWDVSCNSQDSLGSANATSKLKLLVRTLDPFAISDIVPKYFSLGTGGDVTVTGTGFPSDVDLVCATAHYAFGNQLKTTLLFKPSTLYKVKATVVDNTHVNCTFPNLHLPATIKVYILPAREVKLLSALSIDRVVKGGVVFEYRETSPSVTEARLSDNLFDIVIKFNKAIRFVAWTRSLTEEDFCDLILENGATVLGDKPKCRISGSNKLIISPGKGAKPASPVTKQNPDHSIGTITMKAGSLEVRTLNGASEPFPRTNISVMQPKKPISPLIHIKGTYWLEPCEIANMYFFVSEGVDPWPHKYTWNADVSEYVATNTKKSIIDHLKDVVERKGMKKIQFKNFQPGGNYSISVTVENFLGSRSNKSIEIKAKSHSSALRIQLQQANMVLSTSSSFTLRAKSSFLKPKCSNEENNDNQTLSADIVSKLRLKYIWEAWSADGSAIELADNDSPKITVFKKTLKPGKYTFTITAIYFESGKEQGRASASAEVLIKSSAIVARIGGPQTRIVMTDYIIALDGSRSSDPDGETLTYRWTCVEVDTGAACTVGKEVQNGNMTTQVLERADVAFTRYQTADGKLNFPAKLFKTDAIIKVTLTVRAGSRSNVDSAVIVIKDASNNLPQIAIQPLIFEENNGFFSSNEILRIKSIIFGNTKPWTMIISWSSVEDDGLAYIDLETVNLTEVEATRNVTGPRGIRFPLVIKKNSLVPGSTYKFRLQARPDPEIHLIEEGKDESALAVYAEITVTTLAVPTGGDFYASPKNGTALATEFTLQADDWSGGSEDELLYYRFAYKSREGGQNNRGLTFLGSFSEQPEIVIRLPPGKEANGYALPVAAFIRIGDDENTVRIVTSDVIVKPVSNDVSGKPSIDDDVIQDIVNEIAEALVSGDTDATISKAISVSKSVGDDKEKRKKVRDLADAALKTMKTFKPSSESDAGDALESVADVLSEFTGEVSTSTEAKEVALELVKNILKDLFNYDSSSPSRRKRATDQSNQATISVTLAEKLLIVYDKLFASNDELPSNTNTNFEKDTEFIMKSFCQAIAYDEPTQVAKSDFFLVAGRKVRMPHGNSYGSDALKFTLNSAVENQYSSWDCDTSSNISCPGACVSYGIYQMDVIPYQVDSADSDTKRISSIAGFFIRNPSDGSKTTSEVNATGIDYVITIRFKNLSIASEDVDNIRCRHLEFFLWTNESCSVKSVTTTEVTCTCKKLSGYFSVFNIAATTLTTPPATTEVSTVETSPSATSQPQTSPNSVTTSSNPIQCKSPMILAETCPSSCLDWCHKIGEPCSEICVPKKSCICSDGKHKKNGNCYEEEKCDDQTDDGDKQPSTMGTEAIVGLTVAIVAVSGCLAVAVYLLYKKSTSGKVTPTNSTVEFARRPIQKYKETQFTDTGDGQALFSDEKEGTSSGVDNKAYDRDLLKDPPPYSEKEDVSGQTPDPKGI